MAKVRFSGHINTADGLGDGIVPYKSGSSFSNSWLISDGSVMGSISTFSSSFFGFLLDPLGSFYIGDHFNNINVMSSPDSISFNGGSITTAVPGINDVFLNIRVNGVNYKIQLQK